MNHNTTVLSPELGEQVLKVLGSYTRLPSWGLLAGQAVASAIDEVLGTGVPVYNDIDWFVPESQWELDANEEFKRFEGKKLEVSRLSPKVRFSHDEELMSDGYEQTLRVAARELYDITHAQTDGVLNKVAVNWHWSAQQKRANQALDLIRVFDINAVQACVDLSTGLLTVTPAYEAFFRHRQLKLQNLFTPYQSLLRLLKKSQELKGVYVNTEQAIDLVHHRVLQNQGTDELVHLRQEAFKTGAVFVDRDAIQQQSTRAPGSLGDLSTTWLRAGEGLANAPLCLGSKYQALHDAFADKVHDRFELTPRKKGRLALVCANKAGARSSVCSVLMPAVMLASPEKAATLHEQLSLRAGPRMRQRRELLAQWLQGLSDATAKAVVTQAYAHWMDDYLEGLDSPRLLQEVLKVQIEHPEYLLAVGSLPFALQHQALRLLRKKFKQFDVPEAWGVLRNYNGRSVRAWLKSPDMLDDIMRELEGTKEPLAPQLELPAFVWVNTEQGRVKVEVLDLISQYELNREGAKLRHCVAGYGPQVRERRCHIVSFRAGPGPYERATAEWRLHEDVSQPPLESWPQEKKGALHSMHPLTVAQQQYRSFGNSQPSEVLLQAEAQVREHLKAWLSEHPVQGWNYQAQGYEQTKAFRKLLGKGTPQNPAPAPRRLPEAQQQAALTDRPQQEEFLF